MKVRKFFDIVGIVAGIIGTVIGGIILIFITPFVPNLHAHFYHPSVNVDVEPQKMIDGVPDLIFVTNDGGDAAHNLTLTVTGPHTLLGGSVAYTTTEVILTNHSNFFAVTAPIFPNGPASFINITSWIAHKSQITSGHYIVDFYYGGVASKRIVVSLLHPQVGNHTANITPTITVIDTSSGGLLTIIGLSGFYLFLRSGIGKGFLEMMRNISDAAKWTKGT